MKDYFSDHAQRKAEVLEYLGEVSDILVSQENDSEAGSFKKLAEYIEDDLFSIVLVGEFSSGKSTFLNALMHKRILPSFTSETTATVNFLRHKEKAPTGEAGIVYYNDGRMEALPDLELKTIENVVSTRSEKGEKAVAATINHVDLFLESQFLKNGIMLVDSPGLNGIAENHLEITRKQIEQSHAAIFMFSADHPGSKSDFEHLEELKSHSKNIFFVLNKINDIKTEEGDTVERVINSLKDSYHKMFPEETEIPKIWPIAADAALVARDETFNNYHGEVVKTSERRAELEIISRLGAFEERLLQYLTQGERTRDQLLEPVHKAVEKLNSNRKFLEEEQRILENEESPEEMLKAKEKLEEQLKELEKEKKEIAAPVRIAVDKSTNNLKNSIGAKFEKITNNIDAEIDAIDSVQEMIDYAENVENTLNKKYAKVARTLKEEIYEEIIALVREKCFDYLMELSEAFDQVHNNSNVEVKQNAFEIREIKLTANLEQFDKEIAELDAEIASIEKANSMLRKKRIKTQKIELDLQDLEQQKRELQAHRNYIYANTTIPAVQKHYIAKEENVARTYEEDGFLGWLAGKLIGKKKITKREETVERAAHDQAEEELHVKIKDVDNQIGVINAQIQNVGSIEESSEQLICEIEENETRRAELKNKIIEKQNALRKKLNENAKEELRNLRKQIKCYVEESGEGTEEVLKKFLVEQKNEYMKTVNSLVTKNIEMQLKDYNEKLDKIIDAISTTGEERKRRLEEIQILLGKVTECLDKGLNIQTKLESVLNDVIEQENL
ncbi:Dynamin family protein [Succiniclasticum ruminis]|uniref:Dynamin family protein n=1 Tax=Succiniclasticum ruminis TaxID=40841 RepID=A0A1G6KH82_9FIRM|nr:dynamin family protein [Succiniclasticum ruminis]SDC30171.1 Dynamin family protein [Succiniclasticum ruminis]